MSKNRKPFSILPSGDYLEAMIGDFFERQHELRSEGCNNRRYFTITFLRLLSLIADIVLITYQNITYGVLNASIDSENGQKSNWDKLFLLVNLPEDCLSEISVLKRRMEKRKTSAWKIRRVLAQECLLLLWAWYVRIPFDNLFLSSSKDDTVDN